VTGLNENILNRTLAREEPKLKLWRNAGLLLTYRCNAACGFCYYNCGPYKNGLMSVRTAIEAWRSLGKLAATARVHLTGGEPFLYPERLFEILAAAKREKLGSVHLIETNGFWGGDNSTAAEYLDRLAEFDIKRLKISVDPFHLEFIDRDTVKSLAAAAAEALGEERVQIRWRRYLDHSTSTDPSVAATDYPFRFTGRAAAVLAGTGAKLSLEAIAAANCKIDLLGAKGVHVDPYGNVFSSTCSGIIVGNVLQTPLNELWRNFDPSKAEFISTLFHHGPAGLLQQAAKLGYPPAAAYAGKCHLCTNIRQFFFEKGAWKNVVGPADCYEDKRD
jgi:MoaA/NifB/PqqE/SkfB family radical SAM enzyme